jgi:5-bromo-4-chloroindolyl phosphate hydrolysis protein
MRMCVPVVGLVMIVVVIMVMVMVVIVVVMMMSVTIVLGGAGVLVLDVAVIGGADRKRLAALKVDELGLGIV